MAVSFYQRAVKLDEREDDQANLCVGLCNLSETQRIGGAVRSAEAMARAALIIDRRREDQRHEGVSLYRLGLALAVRGESADAKMALERARGLAKADSHQQREGYDQAGLGQAALWRGDTAAARRHADHAWELAEVQRLEADFIRAARLQGTATLHLNDLAIVDERLHYALSRARACNLVEEELPTLIALAELHARQHQPDAVRQCLDDVWEAAERGPYPLFHADALLVLARLERDTGQHRQAIENARRAYELAWLDGPPFAYHWGLQAARQLLAELGAPEPVLPPFDDSKFDPMPEVEINPPGDEFS